jgi:hypothetical protein
MGLRHLPLGNGREEIMKKANLGLALASGIYGGFMAVFFSLRLHIPVGTLPAILASVIYVSVMSVFLRGWGRRET